MQKMPPDILAVIQEFLAEGMPVEQIAFMARVSESVVRRVAAEENGSEPVNTTSQDK